MNRSHVIILTAVLIGAGVVYHASVPVEVVEREMTAEDYFASLNPEPVEMDPDPFRNHNPALDHELDAMTLQQMADIIRKDYGNVDAAASSGRLYPLEVSQ